MKPHCNHDTNRLLEAFHVATDEGPFADTAKKAQVLVDQASVKNHLQTVRHPARNGQVYRGTVG